MDKLLYISMSGAKQNMIGLSVRANNLANAKTVGFKADFEQARSMQAFGEGLPTRVFAMTESPKARLDGGSLKTTDRELDIALSPEGWMEVLDKDGKAAYTREGNLQVTSTGELRTARGNQVVGEAGPIILPVPVEKVLINPDGSVQVRPQGAPANFLEVVDRIKAIKVDNHYQLNKNDDGLFRPNPKELDANGHCDFCDASPDVSFMSGMLEYSNVNPVNEMVSMISHQRQFEMQVKMMSTAEKIDESQSSLMRIV